MELNNIAQVPKAFDINNNAIVFSFNDNFVKYFGVALQSLIVNSNEEKEYDVVVFETNISAMNKERLLLMVPPNFSLRFLNINDYVYKFIHQFVGRCSVETYYRLFIPFIMQNYEKVLYLDADIIINRNIDEMFEIDCEDKLLPEIQSSPRNEYLNEIGVYNVEQYFNAGVALFNISNIDLNNYHEKMKKTLNKIFDLYTSKDISRYFFADQDALNSIFYDETKEISSSFNFMLSYYCYWINVRNFVCECYIDELREVKENPHIIHYAGQYKPWNVGYLQFQGQLADIFWHYARQTVFYEEILLSAIAK